MFLENKKLYNLLNTPQQFFSYFRVVELDILKFKHKNLITSPNRNDHVSLGNFVLLKYNLVLTDPNAQ